MKKIYILLVLLLSPLSSFANKQIDIQTSAREVEMGVPFTITISLKNLGMQQSQGQVSLPGIENFDVFSQGTSNMFQDINGETQSVTQLVIELQARQAGEFEIGPVEIIGDEILRDNEKINITVAGNSRPKLQPMIGGKSNSEDAKKQDQIEDIFSSKDSGEVSGLREINFPLWAHGAFIVFFISCFYLLLSYALRSDTTIKIKNNLPEKIENNTSESKKYFQNLAEKIGVIGTEEFFHIYNTGIRNIFVGMGVKDAQSATLSELTRDATINGKDEFIAFKKSYRCEYSGIEVSEQTQEKYIDNILTILSK